MSDKAKEELEIPKELQEMMEEYVAAKSCKEAAVTRWFGFKRALRYAKIEIRLEVLFWKKVKELYPQVVLKPYSYNFETGKVTEDE